LAFHELPGPRREVLDSDRKGKADGVRVVFEITNPRNGAVTKFDLTLVSEAKLEGSASSEVGGDQRTMALKLARVRE